MIPLRLAVVEYINTTPLIAGLEHLRGLELLRLPPARIGASVLGGGSDAGLVSIADAADSRGELTVLGSGAIGCDGPTMTVRLYARRPLAELSTLHADNESRTSVALCRLLLHHLHGARPAIVPFEAREHERPGPQAMLLIGDKVITHAPPADEYPHHLDLGEAWKLWTGMPFVYAAWAVRTDRAHEAWVGTLADTLDRQRRRNAMRLSRIVAEESIPHGWAPEDAGRYVGSLLRYELGPDARAAADRFVSECADLGILLSGELRWLLPEAARA